MPRSLDVATQVPHGAVRAYVMGERGARNEPATPDDIAAMAEIVRAGDAGRRARLLDLAHDRAHGGRRRAGARAPSPPRTSSSASAACSASSAPGIFELAPAGVMGEDLLAPASEVAWMRKLSAETGRPISFGLSQHNLAPEAWREMLRLVEEANANGADLRPQVAAAR